MAEIQTTIAPHTQAPYVQRTYPATADLDAAIARAAQAQKTWAQVPLERRLEIGKRFVEEFKKMSEDVATELTAQMGRPITQSPGEIRGLVERATYMLDIAPQSLQDVSLADTDKPGFKRFIRRVPLGLVLIIAPWNFPYLTAINAFLPALLAGNAVLLKPSPQTPLTAERLAAALTAAGLPEDVFTVLHLSPDLTKRAVQDPHVHFVSFTGSVVGGRAVEQAAVEASGFKGVALELGGKDPAYVREDADLEYTVPELVDGAFFNSGQSCCSVERIYVHENVYEEFVRRFVDVVKTYKLGDPTDPSTNLGPVVSVASAERVRKQVKDAVEKGARALIPEELFVAAKPGTAFVAPQVVVDVDHSMDIMKEETFGPVIGIMKVPSDAAALALINDSPYGLTASVWTDAQRNPDSERVFRELEGAIEAGTVFLNRCDYLDPALAWTGFKDSGRGVGLSRFGYDQLTRAKSVHMKIVTSV